nr:hypothetical protein [Microbacterium bovistercoris]
MTTPIDQADRPTVRFMVRLEHARPTRFGENPRHGVQWTVTPYLGRRADGALIGALQPRPFPTRAAAFRHARFLAAQQRARLFRLHEQRASDEEQSFADALVARLHAGSEG